MSHLKLQKERLEELSKNQESQQKTPKKKRNKQQAKTQSSKKTTEESANQRSVPDVPEAETVAEEEEEANLVPRKRAKKSAQGDLVKDIPSNLSGTENISERAIVEYRPPRIISGFVSAGVIKSLEYEGVSSSNEKLKLYDLKMLERRNKRGIGSSHIRYENLSFTDPCPLTTKPDEVLTSDHLTKIEY